MANSTSSETDQAREVTVAPGGGGPRGAGWKKIVSGRELRELLGVLGVIASLIFVGLEIRQNTRVARAEAYRGVEQVLAEWNFVSASDPELAALLRGVVFEGRRREELSDSEKWRVGVMLDVLIRGMESIYRQVQHGVLPASALDAYGEVNNVFRSAYVKDVWPLVKPNYRPDFAEYFEARFALVP